MSIFIHFGKYLYISLNIIFFPISGFGPNRTPFHRPVCSRPAKENADFRLTDSSELTKDDFRSVRCAPVVPRGSWGSFKYVLMPTLVANIVHCSASTSFEPFFGYIDRDFTRSRAVRKYWLVISPETYIRKCVSDCPLTI